MPKVVLYDVDGTLISQSTLGEQHRQLFFPTQTAHIFKEHLRKKDHVIVCSSQSSTDEIKSALLGANIDITKIEILGRAETLALEGKSNNQKKVNKAKAEMHHRGLNAAVIVEDSLSINANDTDVIHILVPTDAPENEPISDSYLQTTLLPTSILKERVKPQVEQIKSSTTKGLFNIESLGNLYDRVTRLFTIPNSYNNLCLSKNRMGKTGYEIGLSLLLDYCKNQPPYFSIIGKVHRFFTGHWNRHHTEAVEKLLNGHVCNFNGESNFNFEGTAQSLLKHLKNHLIEAGNPINPAGSLARRIEFIQSKTGVSIIDIDDLNAEINNRSTSLVV